MPSFCHILFLNDCGIPSPPLLLMVVPCPFLLSHCDPLEYWECCLLRSDVAWCQRKKIDLYGWAGSSIEVWLTEGSCKRRRSQNRQEKSLHWIFLSCLKLLSFISSVLSQEADILVHPTYSECVGKRDQETEWLREIETWGKQKSGWDQRAVWRTGVLQDDVRMKNKQWK